MEIVHEMVWSSEENELGSNYISYIVYSALYNPAYLEREYVYIQACMFKVLPQQLGMAVLTEEGFDN